MLEQAATTIPVVRIRLDFWMYLSNADNYNSEANHDDGSCIYEASCNLLGKTVMMPV